MSDSLEVRATGAAADAVGRHVPELVADSFLASRLFDPRPHPLGTGRPRTRRRSGSPGSRLPRSPARSWARSRRSAASSPSRASTASCSAAWAAPRSRPRSSARPHGVDLTVLDSSHPDQVRARARGPLERTVVVVSSKSGSTVETDSQRRAFEPAFKRGRDRPAPPDRRRDRPGLPARRGGRERRLPRRQRRPRRRRPLLRADRVRPRAQRARRRDIGAAARRGRAVPTCSPPTTRRTRPASRRGHGRHRPAARQAGDRRRGLRAARLRRLGRAAHRREHRQGRHGHAAGRRAAPTPPRSSRPPT